MLLFQNNDESEDSDEDDNATAGAAHTKISMAD